MTLADESNLAVVELGYAAALASWFATGGVAVLNILKVGHPSKIVQSVVGRIEVFVVALFAALWRSHESAKDEVVNRLTGKHSVHCHSHQNVAISQSARAENPARLEEASASRFVLYHHVERADATKRGNLVSWVSNYCAPLFCGRILNSHRAPFVGQRSGL